MKLVELIQSIRHAIFKPDLIDSLYNLTKEIKEVNLPVLKEARELFPETHVFQSREIKRLIPTFNGIVKKRQGGIVTTIYATHENMIKMFDKVRPYVEASFQEQTPAEALTYKKAQYIQLIETAKFYLSYTRSFINYIILSELSKHDPGNQIQKRLTPVQIKKVEQGYSNFCVLTNVFNGNVSEVMGLLNRVPDIAIIPESADSVEAAIGKDKLDPLKFNFISANLNPFAAFQTARALWNHQKYELAIEEKEALRLKLINLKQIQYGSPDPSVQREIEVSEERIQQLEYFIAKEEEEFGA